MAIEYAAIFGHKDFLIAVVTEIEEMKTSKDKVDKKFVQDIVADILDIGPKLKLKFSDIMNHWLEIDRTLLGFASRLGNERLVEWILLNSMPSMDNSDPPALHFAFIEGHTAIAKLLIRLPVTQNPRNEFFPSIHLAAHLGDAELVQMILEKNGENQSWSQEEIHPLNVAAYEGHKCVVETLLNYHFYNLCASCRDIPPPYTLTKLVEEIVQLGKRANNDGAPDLFLMALKENNNKLARILMTILYYSCEENKDLSTHHYTFPLPHFCMPTPEAYNINIHNVCDPWLGKQKYKSNSEWLIKTINTREHRPERDTQEDEHKKEGQDYSNTTIPYIPGKSLNRVLSTKKRDLSYLTAIPRMICYNGDIEIAKMSGLKYSPADAFVAGLRGHVELAKMLIAAGCSIDTSSYDFYYNFEEANEIGDIGTAFLNGACVSGNVELVRICLETMQLKPGGALYKAACSGQLEVVKELLKFGADKNENFSYGKEKHTALHGAAQNGHLNVVRELIKRNASVNSRITPNPDHTFVGQESLTGTYHLQSPNGEYVPMNYLIPFTPLQLALSTRQFSVARELISAGASLKYHPHTKKEKEHVMHVMEEDSSEHEDITTLYYAVSRGAEDIVRICLRSDNYSFANLNHLLCIAAYYGHWKVVKALLPQLTGNNGKLSSNSLNFAIEGGHLSIVRMLMENGATFNECLNMKPTSLRGVNQYISTPSSIHKAVERGDVKMVEFLLGQGVSANFTPKQHAEHSLLSKAVIQQHSDSGGTIIIFVSIIISTKILL